MDLPTGDDVIGFLVHENGMTVTLVMSAPGALTDAPFAVFPTADPKSVIGAVDVQFLALMAQFDNPEEHLNELAMVMVGAAEALPPADLSWVHEGLDN